MIDYGAGPGDAEVELVVFGPGFGESIALHVGDQHWVLIDSCIDPGTRGPAALAYLSSIGVPLVQVRAIVASHWHDDHVRGIAATARECGNAEFHLSGAFNNREAMTFLAAFSGTATGRLSRGSSELFSVVDERAQVWHSHQRSTIFEVQAQGRRIRLAALSPVQAAMDQMIANFAQYLPRPGADAPIRNAVPLSPNLEAVAVHVDLDGEAILLGSDLEEHASLGWTAITADAWCGQRTKASVYKLAHHGSSTGDSPAIWTTLLCPDPHAVATPFNLGRHRLPTEKDRQRIKSCTSNAYVTSGAGRKPRMDSSQLKRLADIAKDLRPVNNGFGAVRLRKAFTARTWNTQCFGDARPLSQ